MILYTTIFFRSKCRFFNNKVLKEFKNESIIYVFKVIFVFFLVSFSAIKSFSQTNIWDGSTNNNWNNAANWSLNIVPTSVHDVVININAAINVDVSPINLKSLSINGNVSVSFTCSGASQTINLTNTGTGLSINNGCSLSLIGSNAGGGRSMNITFSTATSTSSIAGTLILLPAGGGSSYNSTNSLTTVTGTINNQGGTITSTSGNLAFAASSTYIHGINGGTIPTALWNVNSNCNITGITNITPLGLNQTFGNFTWNSPGHSATINLNGNLTNIAGNLSINQAGNPSGIRVTDPLVLTQNTNTILNIGGNFTLSNTGSAAWFALTNGTASVTLNVGGNFNLSNATSFFDYNIGSTQNSALTVNVTGNYSQTDGFLDWAFTPTTGTVASELRVKGNFNHSGSALISTSIANSGSAVPNGKIIFNQTGLQTISITTPLNIGYTNFEVASGSTLELLSNLYLYSSNTARWGGNFVVKSGGVFNVGTFQLQSLQPNGVNNVFVLESGAGIITANANGIQNGITGSVFNVIATRTFSSAANYTYDGTVTQNSGTFVTTPVANQINNLTISNTSGNTTGVTLQQPIAVAGTCNFNAGLLTTSSINLLTINDNAIVTLSNNTYTNSSFANGPVKKIGNDAFDFPVGKLVGGYRILSISVPANTTDAFTCEFLRANARLLGPVSPPLTRVSQCEYWKLDKNSSAAASIQVTISWNELSPCNATYVTNPFLLAVARFEGPNWINAGFFPINGTNTSGNITSNLLSDFGYFSLGSRDFLENVLPVSLFDLQLQKNKDGISVNWKNTKEEKVAYYQVMRSTNGKDFIPVAVVNATQNNGSEVRYTFIDRSASQTIYYYRIKLMNNENDQFYSNTVKINLESRIGSLNILSNPVTDHRLGIQLSDLPAGIYNLTLLNNSGQIVYKNSINHINGSATYAFQLSSSLTKGIYYLQLNTADNKFSRSILIQ